MQVNYTGGHIIVAGVNYTGGTIIVAGKLQGGPTKVAGKPQWDPQ